MSCNCHGVWRPECPEHGIESEAWRNRNRRAPIQSEYDPETRTKYPAGSISWEEHLEAWQAYDKKWRSGQSAERIAQRGGFGYREATELLGRPLATFEARL